MSNWYTVNCGHCGCEIPVHQDWDNEPEYCKDCSWIVETCEICGGELRVHRSWSNPPAVHKECRQQKRDKWREKQCEHCGETIRYHEDWDKIPAYCSNCNWYEVTCAICGELLRVNRQWAKPPKTHKDCRERERAKWLTRTCANCGKDFTYHRDWKNIPEYCKECLWYETDCFICGQTMKIRRDWAKPPKAHKECIERYRPRQESCRECGHTFTISTGLQLKCREKGWNLPTKCPQCKQDSLLISGAIAAAREYFSFPLKAVIEPRGLIFTEKVAVIYNRKTGVAVAEVKMEDRGILFKVREAVLADCDETLSRTREAREGFLANRRVADTYGEYRGEKTHRTRDTTEGFIFKRRVREAENVDTKEKIKVHQSTKGILSPKTVIDSDK